MNLSAKEIEQKIYFVRGHQVMLDRDLALLYQVETGALKRAVRRNILRFPDDFMFELTLNEYENLRCQIGISSLDIGNHGGIRYLPFVFTEHGVSMLSSVLNSERAIHVNISIIRTFVELRKLLESDQHQLQKKLYELENKFIQYDQKFITVFEAIRQLIEVGSSNVRKKIRTLSEK